MRILVIEDDARGRLFLARGLAESGHIVDTASDGATGLVLAREGIYDLLVTDRLLPALDGVDLVRQLRAGGDVTPVLMLSAVGGLKDRVDGIQAGCDDYLVKPYAFAELLARVEALERRSGSGKGRRRTGHVWSHADLSLDTRARSATCAGRNLNLQHREFLLLECLMRHAGQVVTRSMFLEAAWNYDFEPRGDHINRAVQRLRAKVDRHYPTPLIRTVMGAGYVLDGSP